MSAARVTLGELGVGGGRALPFSTLVRRVARAGKIHYHPAPQVSTYLDEFEPEMRSFLRLADRHAFTIILAVALCAVWGTVVIQKHYAFPVGDEAQLFPPNPEIVDRILTLQAEADEAAPEIASAATR